MIKLVILCLAFSTISLVSKEINVGIFDFYPASFKDNQGNYQGFYIDLINEIAKDNNWEIKYHYSSLNDNLNKLRSGELDLMPGLIINDSRLSFLDFSSSYILTGWSSFNYNKKYKINGVKDLIGLRIGLIKNDINNEMFLSLFSDNKLTPKIKFYDSFSEMLQEIRKDSIVGGIFRNLLYEWKDPEDQIVTSPIKFPITESFFAAPKGKNEDLLFVIDSTLKVWKSQDDSQYYSILDKWINPKPDYFRYIISISLILIFIIFTYFLYRIYKKKK